MISNPDELWYHATNRLAWESLFPPKQVSLNLWQVYPGVELLVWHEVLDIYSVWAFFCHAVFNWRNVNQTVCFLVGLVLFFNSTNLDTELVVAILGQDSPCESSIFFDFPPYYSVPSLLNLQVGSILFHPFAQIARHCFSLVASLIQSNSTMASSGMRRTHSDAFQDRAPPVLEPKIELLLHVALSPVQFHMLWINVQFCLIHTPLDSACGQTLSRQWKEPAISCAGALPMMSHLCRLPSRSSWFAPFGSHLLEFSPYYKQDFWNQEMEATQVAVGTPGTKALCITNFAELLTRAPRSFTTNSRTSTTRWSKVSKRSLHGSSLFNLCGSVKL